MEQPALRPYHQSRWVCLLHGFFDVRLPQRPSTGYRALCPECERPAASRDGYECTGKTSGPIPHRTRPRLEENPEIELVLFDKPKVVKKSRGYYNRHTKEWAKKKR